MATNEQPASDEFAPVDKVVRVETETDPNGILKSACCEASLHSVAEADSLFAVACAACGDVLATDSEALTLLGAGGN
jgi:hypothetical protein